MKLSGVTPLIALVGFFPAVILAADPATIDASRRSENGPSANHLSFEKTSPPRNDQMQERRVAPAPVVKKLAGISPVSTPITATSPNDTTVPPATRIRAAVAPRETNAFDRRESVYQPAAQARPMPLVTRYQAGLSPAGAVSVSRTSATAPATSTRVNRFVQQKNAPAVMSPAAMAVTAASAPR